MIKISASMKQELQAYYKRTDAPIDESEKERVVQLFSRTAATYSAIGQMRSMPFWRFIIGQLRFVSPLAWVAQIALLIEMLLIAHEYGESDSVMLVVMTAAVLSVAIAIPSVFKSFESNVAELEASCHHDSVQVLVSRLILFGLGDVLWMTLAAWLVPAIAGGDPFRVFLYAATPFFAFCSLSFYLSRVTNGRCVKACLAAATCVIAVIWGLNEPFPLWYSNASMVVWSVAFLAALLLAAYETHKLLAHVASDSASRLASLVQA